MTSLQFRAPCLGRSCSYTLDSWWPHSLPQVLWVWLAQLTWYNPKQRSLICRPNYFNGPQLIAVTIELAGRLGKAGKIRPRPGMRLFLSLQVHWLFMKLIFARNANYKNKQKKNCVKHCTTACPILPWVHQQPFAVFSRVLGTQPLSAMQNTGGEWHHAG